MADRSQSVTVRLLREADLDAVRDIVNWAIETTHYNFHTTPLRTEDWRVLWTEGREQYPWLVAESDGEPAGVAYAGRYKVRRAYDWSVETTVYVSHRHHRRGVGMALYDALLPILATQGFHTAIGVIALPNPGSVALHERCGYVAAGETPRVGWKFDRWVGIGNWQKMLQDETHAPTTPLSVSDALARLGRKDLA